MLLQLIYVFLKNSNLYAPVDLRVMDIEIDVLLQELVPKHKHNTLKLTIRGDVLFSQFLIETYICISLTFPCYDNTFKTMF